MKIKHLPIISGLLLTTLLATSCLKSDKQNYVLGTDATIHSMQIDTVYGKKVALTIDQANNRIFNKDSLPVHADTIVNKILITDIVTGGSWITRKLDADRDTIFNYVTDSLDLTKPTELTVYAMDVNISRKYTLQINVHKQDPDSLSWKTFIPQAPLGQAGRIFEALGENLLVFTPDLKIYKAHDLSPVQWEELTVTGLEEITKINRVVPSPEKDKLYLFADQAIYSSTDGASWQKMALDGPVDQLLSVAKSRIMVIGKNDQGVTSFGYAELKDEPTKLVFSSPVPQDFAWDNITSAYYHLSDLVMVLPRSVADQEYAYVWMSENGEDWHKQVSASDHKKCPALEHSQLFYYNNKLYAFGGDYAKFYESLNGMDWNEASDKFYLPAEFKEQGANVFTVDSNRYMWLNFDSSNELWRGRLNKFGHKIQK